MLFPHTPHERYRQLEGWSTATRWRRPHRSASTRALCRPLPLLQLESDQVEDQAGGDLARRSGQVVHWSHLDEVEADDASLLGDPFQEVLYLVVVEPARRRRPVTRGDARIESVGVHRDVVAIALRDAIERLLDPQPAHVAHAQDHTAVGPGGLEVTSLAAADAADPELCHPVDVFTLRDPAHGAAMPVAVACPLVDEIEVGVELHNRERAGARHGLHDRRRDRMVASEDNRHRPPLDDRAHSVAEIFVALVLVAVDDVDITAVDQPPAIVEEYLIPLWVVSAPQGEAVNGRAVADAARAKTRSRAVLRTLVVGHTQDRDVGVELAHVHHDRPL